jgi:hypothetical protein
MTPRPWSTTPLRRFAVGVGLVMHPRFSVTPALVRYAGSDLEARNGNTFRVTFTVNFPPR